MQPEEKIKSRLRELLDSPQSNYNEILSLSNELAEFDMNNIRFSVDAGIIDRLGSELVARQETAVSELVKNAYDADATSVELNFIDSNEIGGTLQISDNGCGMTRDQLVNGFMRISSTDKISNPYSLNFNRKRAGQKGIGRFAVQRLGRVLTITTQSANEENSYKLIIDWDKYIGNQDLYIITNSIIKLPKLELPGTQLRIDGLKDRWSEAAIKRVYRYVSDIIQPFPLSESNPQIIEKKLDPGFIASFFLQKENRKVKIGDEKTMIYDHAIATINGQIDTEGHGKIFIESKKLKLDFDENIGLDPDNAGSKFTKLKNVSFRAFYYIYDSDLMPKQHSAAIRKMANVSGGIRLYRNGFRVLPYGESGDDWISLDLSTRRRSILPVHANINFFGFVEISDASGDFQETSSREGLMNNESLIQLQNFVYRSLLTAVIRIATERNIKITSGQTNNDGIWEDIDIKIKNIAFSLEELDRALEDEEDSIETRKKRKKRIQKIQKDLQRVIKIQREERKKLIDERSMLRVLSSVGLTVGQFIHEIKYYLDNIRSDIKSIKQNSKNETNILNRLNTLEANFATFQTYMSYFDGVISQNVIRDLVPLELRRVVEPFIGSLEKDALKSGIEFKPPIYNKYGLYTIPMHPAEWSSILFNFYTNSKKAIKRTSNKGLIQIECGSENGLVYLEFSDNGDGIPKENEERIFDEFFTTTSQKSLEKIDLNSEILGTGLGLKIVKDIVSSYNGKVMVVSAKNEYVTCIRVEIPCASDKQLDEYGI